MNKGILLDTHTWIWLCQGSTELSNDAIKFIDKTAKEGEVYLAAISVWELSMLVAKNRLTITKPLNQWVKEVLAQPGMNLYPLTPEIAIESSFLPGSFHGDPADRIIVATARIADFTLLTRDSKIINYSKNSHVICFPI